MPKKASKPAAPDFGFRAPAPLADGERSAIEWLAMPAILDIGVIPPWSDAAFAALGPKDKRSYRKQSDEIDNLRRVRLTKLRQVTFEAASTREGQLRLAELIPKATAPDGTVTLIEPLVVSESTPERVALEAAAAALDEPGGGPMMQLYIMAARATLRIEDEAFDRLAPYFEVETREKPGGSERAQGILFALSRGKPADPRWVGLLRSLLAKNVCSGALVHALEHVEVDESFVAPLLRYLDADGKQPNLFDTQAHKLLARIGDRRAAPLFARILEEIGTQWVMLLDGLARFDDPIAIPAIKRWLEKSRAMGNTDAWEGFTAGQRVIDALEKKHGVVDLPPEQPRGTAPIKPAPKRGKGKPRKHGKVPSLDEMRAEHVALFAKLGVPHLLEAMTRPAVQVRLTRVDEAESKLAVGATKFGGRPDLPADVGWPDASGCPLSFIGQVRADAVNGHLPWFPKAGLLSFFIFDEFGEGPSYLSLAKIVHTADVDRLVRKEIPPGFQSLRAGMMARIVYAPCAAELLPILRIAPPSNRLTTRLLDEDARARYADLQPYDFGLEVQLGGFRDHGYDAEQAEQNWLVLQLPSDMTLDVEFGDVETLELYAPEGRLEEVFPYVGD